MRATGGAGGGDKGALVADGGAGQPRGDGGADGRLRGGHGQAFVAQLGLERGELAALGGGGVRGIQSIMQLAHRCRAIGGRERRRHIGTQAPHLGAPRRHARRQLAGALFVAAQVVELPAHRQHRIDDALGAGQIHRVVELERAQNSAQPRGVVVLRRLQRGAPLGDAGALGLDLAQPRMVLEPLEHRVGRLRLKAAAGPQRLPRRFGARARFVGRVTSPAQSASARSTSPTRKMSSSRLATSSERRRSSSAWASAARMAASS